MIKSMHHIPKTFLEDPHYFLKCKRSWVQTVWESLLLGRNLMSRMREMEISIEIIQALGEQSLQPLRIFFFFFTYSDPSGVGNGNPLQYSCLENSMNRGAWQATVHGHRVRHDWAFIHTSPRSQGSPWARRKSQRKGKGRLWNVSGQAAGGDIGPNNLHLKSHSPVGRCLKCQTSLPQMDSENWEECPKVPTVLYFKKIYS